MLEFIMVLGEDPFYKSQSLYQYIAVHTIVRVYPYWGVQDKEDPDKYWRCLQGFKGGKIFSYGLITADGKEYSCGNKEELAKLGIDLEKKNRNPIGFATDSDNGPTILLDPVEQ